MNNTTNNEYERSQAVDAFFKDHSAEKAKLRKSRKHHIILNIVLAVLLVASIAAGGCFGVMSYLTANKTYDLENQVDDLNAELDSTASELNTAKIELDSYCSAFGVLDLPQLDSDAGNYDSVITAYESKTNKLTKALADINKQTDEIKAKDPNKKKANAETTSKKVCYLTFDDGPSDNTLKILDILDRYNAKATFFVIGATGKFDYIKNIHERGQAVALHTNSHSYETIYSSPDAYFADLQALSDRVEAITGEKIKLLRFPGGSSNTVSRSYCNGIMTTLTKMVQDKGYTYFDWNIDSGDASGNNIPAEKLINNIKSVNYANYGEICVLCHDAAAKSTTVEALPQIIEYLSSQGYTFESLKPDTRGFHQGINN